MQFLIGFYETYMTELVANHANVRNVGGISCDALGGMDYGSTDMSLRK